VKKITKMKLTVQGWFIALGLSMIWSCVLGVAVLIHMIIKGDVGSIGEMALFPIVVGVVFGGAGFLFIRSPIWKILVMLSDLVPYGGLVFFPVPLLFYYVFSWPAIQIGTIMEILVDADKLEDMPKPDRTEKVGKKEGRKSIGSCPYAGAIMIDKETTVLGGSWPYQSEIFKISSDWKVKSKGAHFGWIDKDGGIHQNPFEGKEINPDATLDGAVAASIKGNLCYINGKEIGKLQ